MRFGDIINNANNQFGTNGQQFLVQNDGLLYCLTIWDIFYVMSDRAIIYLHDLLLNNLHMKRVLSVDS